MPYYPGVMSRAPLISNAFISAALGSAMPPVVVSHCRIKAAAPEVSGVAMLVPPM